MWVTAIRTVAAGGGWFSEIPGRRLLRRKPPQPTTLLAPLTEREEAVLLRLTWGQSNQAIAEGLQIKPHTVETHITHILRKLQLKNRTAAALWQLNKNLTP